MMRNGFGKGGLRGVDYSKTCFHNPHVVFKAENEGVSAI